MIACDRHNNMHYCLFVLCVLILLAPFTPRVFANPHRCRRPTTVNQIVAPVTVATVVPGYQATAFRQRTVTRQRIIATQPNAVLAAALVAPQPVYQRQLVQQQLLVQPASEALRYRQQTQLLPQNTAYLMGVADTQLTQPQRFAMGFRNSWSSRSMSSPNRNCCNNSWSRRPPLTSMKPRAPNTLRGPSWEQQPALVSYNRAFYPLSETPKAERYPWGAEQPCYPQPPFRLPRRMAGMDPSGSAP
jgi:hypothetical protein